MRPSRRSNNRSFSKCRSRFSALLIAGWLRPLNSAALVTWRSAISASKATSRLRSMPRKLLSGEFLSVIAGIALFLSFMSRIFFRHFRRASPPRMVRRNIQGGRGHGEPRLDASQA
jgi:hypothetical protein